MIAALILSIYVVFIPVVTRKNRELSILGLFMICYIVFDLLCRYSNILWMDIITFFLASLSLGTLLILNVFLYKRRHAHE